MIYYIIFDYFEEEEGKSEETMETMHSLFSTREEAELWIEYAKLIDIEWNEEYKFNVKHTYIIEEIETVRSVRDALNHFSEEDLDRLESIILANKLAGNK